MARSYIFKQRSIKRPKLQSSLPSFMTVQKELARKMRTGGIPDRYEKHPIGSLSTATGPDPFDFTANTGRFKTIPISKSFGKTPSAPSSPKFSTPKSPRAPISSAKFTTSSRPQSAGFAPSKASKNGLF